jgi:hypothetical protein
LRDGQADLAALTESAPTKLHGGRRSHAVMVGASIGRPMT